VSERLHQARKGVRGGCRGAEPPTKKKIGPTYFRPVSGRHIFAGPTYFRDDIFPGPHDIRWFLAHGFLPMVFYFRLRN
jgi:hypothetical protein